MVKNNSWNSTYPVGIGSAGTNAGSFTQIHGIVTYNGTSLVNYAGPQISASGYYTNSSHPAFVAYLSTNPTNVTGDGTNYKIVFNTALNNKSSSYGTGTGTFTAPVAGFYCFILGCTMSNIVNQTQAYLQINTSAGNFTNNVLNSKKAQDSASIQFGMQIGVSLGAGGTAEFYVVAQNSTLTVGLVGGFENTYCMGYLVC